jgi:hypothetical protein
MPGLIPLRASTVSRSRRAQVEQRQLALPIRTATAFGADGPAPLGIRHQQKAALDLL